MIFVTVGSHPRYKFQRLIDALTLFPADELIVQYGPAARPDGVAEAYEWLSFPDMLHYMQRASAVITHAGVGTILCAMDMGRKPIVMPRLKRFGETVDDHQVEFATVLERTGRVSVAWTAEQLRELAPREWIPHEPPWGKSHALQDAVRAALIGAAP